MFLNRIAKYRLFEIKWASKGSISTALRFLVPSGWVARLSRTGDRRSYFRLQSEAWLDLAKRQAEIYSAFAALMSGGMRLLHDATAERMERLRALQELFDWLDQEMPKLLERWERERGGRR